MGARDRPVPGRRQVSGVSGPWLPRWWEGAALPCPAHQVACPGQLSLHVPRGSWPTTTHLSGAPCGSCPPHACPPGWLSLELPHCRLSRPVAGLVSVLPGCRRPSTAGAVTIHPVAWGSSELLALSPSPMPGSPSPSRTCAARGVGVGVWRWGGGLAAGCPALAGCGRWCFHPGMGKAPLIVDLNAGPADARWAGWGGWGGRVSATWRAQRCGLCVSVLSCFLIAHQACITSRPASCGEAISAPSGAIWGDRASAAPHPRALLAPCVLWGSWGGHSSTQSPALLCRPSGRRCDPQSAGSAGCAWTPCCAALLLLLLGALGHDPCLAKPFPSWHSAPCLCTSHGHGGNSSGCCTLRGRHMAGPLTPAPWQEGTWARGLSPHSASSAGDDPGWGLGSGQRGACWANMDVWLSQSPETQEAWVWGSR